MSMNLTDELKVAGHQFHQAIAKLGLEPDVLCWANVGGELQLVMVTSLVDRVGPLEIYKTLFRAQEWGVIEPDFELMDVSIYAPSSELGKDVESTLSSLIKSTGHLTVQVEKRDVKAQGALFSIGYADPFVVDGGGIYVVKKTGFSAVQDLKRWKHVQRNLTMLAA